MGRGHLRFMVADFLFVHVAGADRPRAGVSVMLPKGEDDKDVAPPVVLPTVRSRASITRSIFEAGAPVLVAFGQFPLPRSKPETRCFILKVWAFVYADAVSTGSRSRLGCGVERSRV